MKIFKTDDLAVICALFLISAACPRLVCAQAAGAVKAPEYLKWVDSAGKGNADSAFMLGMAYYYDMFDAKQDYGQASQWFVKAANGGSGRACSILGDMNYFGRGGAANKTEAMKWYRKGADIGEPEAQEKLGDMYYYGEAVVKNYAEASKWYRKAAEKGTGPGPCAKLGGMYLLGEGVQLDYPEALKWYLKADSLGDTGSSVYIAEIYRSGLGVKKDPGKAAEWLIKGSVAGDFVAMYRLGKAYAAGEGVNRSYTEAYKWLAVVAAAKENTPFAQNLLAKVSKKMSTSELASAKKEAAKLVEKYVKP